MARGQVRVGAGTGEQFAALARDLRRAGAATLRRELYAGLQRAGKATIEGVKDSAAQSLPQAGGLADVVAGAKYGIRQQGAQRGGAFSIRITASRQGSRGEMDLRALDERGVIRHPLYGNRHHWYTTRTRPGWFSEPAARLAVSSMEPQLRAVVDAIEKDISGR